MSFLSRLIVPLLTVAVTAVRAESPGTPRGSEVVVERFQIPKGAILLLVPVELKGKMFLFALDTGASSSIYDSSLAPLLGDPVSTQEVRTHDGVARLPLFTSPHAKLGGLSLRTESPVVTADLGNMRQGLGEEVYGLIGMDFLSTHVFRVDPDRGEVVFLKSAGPDPGQRLPVAIENKVPYVRVQLAGLADPVPFLVDTGCVPGGGTGLLRTERFDALAKQASIRPIDVALAGSLSGSSMRRRGRVTEVELAGYRHPDLIFGAAQQDVIGVGYWSRYVATFDFAGGAIYMKKGSRFDQRDMHDLSGLTIVRVANRTVVVGVDEGSPAARAGVESQDVILRVNGDKVEEMALMSVRRLLACKRTKVSMVLKRAAGEREVSFDLPD